MLSVTSRRSHAEIKTVDTANTHAATLTMALNTTGSVQVVNLIQPGDEYFQRIGRRIEMKSFFINGVIQQTGVFGNPNDYCRIAIVYDRQPNGVITTWANVFSSTDQSGTAVSSALSNVNPNEMERYMVLADFRLALPTVTANTDSTAAADGVHTSFNINRFIKLKNLKAHYQAATSPSTIADISTGALYVLTYGSYAAGNDQWQAQLNWRLRYTDT